MFQKATYSKKEKRKHRQSNFRKQHVPKNSRVNFIIKYVLIVVILCICFSFPKITGFGKTYSKETCSNKQHVQNNINVKSIRKYVFIVVVFCFFVENIYSKVLNSNIFQKTTYSKTQQGTIYKKVRFIIVVFCIFRKTIYSKKNMLQKSNMLQNATYTKKHQGKIYKKVRCYCYCCCILYLLGKYIPKKQHVPKSNIFQKATYSKKQHIPKRIKVEIYKKVRVL